MGRDVSTAKKIQINWMMTACFPYRETFGTTERVDDIGLNFFLTPIKPTSTKSQKFEQF